MSGHNISNTNRIAKASNRMPLLWAEYSPAFPWQMQPLCLAVWGLGFRGLGLGRLVKGLGFKGRTQDAVIAIAIVF